MAARILHAHPEIGGLVQADVLGDARPHTGRPGLSGDQVLRIAVLKQIHGLSYRELEFHLQDSDAFRAFVGLGFRDRPSHQALQTNVKAIRPATWEAIHRVLMGFAQAKGIERGGTIRGDTTVVDAAIHEPADSSLLWDCVRVATRLLHRMARRKPTLRRDFSDHTRRAKRRAYAIKFHRRTKSMRGQYRDLIRVAEAVRRDAARVVEETAQTETLKTLVAELQALLPRMDQVLDQAKRRVIEREKVPSNEKIVSIFEPHTDIIVKDNRDTRYGHKVCLTGGTSSLVCRPPNSSGWRTSPSTARADSRSRTWCAAPGSSAACATSARASKAASRRSSAPSTWTAATGAAWIPSALTSGAPSRASI
jgi:IS5 family transposase